MQHPENDEDTHATEGTVMAAICRVEHYAGSPRPRLRKVLAVTDGSDH